eukprot:PhF_6_TR37511/c0_g1_i16/m.55426
MESLYTKFSTHEVLRAVTCLAIHDNIVVPIDVVHTTIELYSWLWTFAPPRQCDPSMPDLTIDGDEFRRHDPEMLIDSSGTVAHHVVTNNNSIVLVTPNFTVEDVITGRVPPCRLRFPFHEQQFSHYVFVYVEGTESSPAIEYSTYTDIGAVVADVSITTEDMLTFDIVTHDIHDSIENAVIPSGNMGDGSICQSCDVRRLPATTRVWFGIYTFSAGASVFLQDF